MPKVGCCTSLELKNQIPGPLHRGTIRLDVFQINPGANYVVKSHIPLCQEDLRLYQSALQLSGQIRPVAPLASRQTVQKNLIVIPVRHHLPGGRTVYAGQRAHLDPLPSAGKNNPRLQFAERARWTWRLLYISRGGKIALILAEESFADILENSDLAVQIAKKSLLGDDIPFPRAVLQQQAVQIRVDFPGLGSYIPPIHGPHAEVELGDAAVVDAADRCPSAMCCIHNPCLF